MRMLLALAAVLVSVVPAGARADNVTTYHNSMARTGAYIMPGLTTNAAGTLHPDPDFHAAISGEVHAQPVFWHPEGQAHGQVIVATDDNLVYALNAETGAEDWKAALGHPVRLSSLGTCGNIDPEGITGAPAIDEGTRTLYLSALAWTPDNRPRHLVHALSLADGREKPGWPLDVQVALAKAGMSFASDVQGQRGAVLVFKGSVYVVYGGKAGDCGNYFGTVVQIALDSGTLQGVWQSRTRGGGIWAQGGITSDGTDLFVATGNTLGASKWSDGDAIFRLRPGLARSTDKKDYFAPSDWKGLDDTDEDLGGTGALPLDLSDGRGDVFRRILGFGKDGKAYLADRDNLGGIGGQIAVVAVSAAAIVSAPAVYSTPGRTLVAFNNASGGKCSGRSLTALSLSGGKDPIATAWCSGITGRGAPILTTTDGAADPIFWYLAAEGDNALHGFDALSGNPVFSGGGTIMSGLRHFQTLIAAEGRLYVAADNRVYAFTFQH